MEMDGRHKDVDAIERHFKTIGMGVHKVEKFFGLRGKTMNTG